MPRRPMAATARPSATRARLPETFDDLLREGGDSLFDAVERALVHAAFDHAHRNQVRAAKALGVTRNMVRTLLKRHGLLAHGSAEADPEGEAGEGEGAEHDAVEHPPASTNATGGGRFSLSAV